MAISRSDNRGVDRRAIASAAGALILSLWSVTGCNTLPPSIRPPNINAQAIADAAIEQYDKNRNGVIDRDELEAAPSLRFALDRCDTNHDHQLTRDEIAAFVQTNWIDQSAGIIRVKCSVKADGRPLDGANVSLVPEEFMGGAVKPASGVTRGGIASLDVSSDDRPTPNAHGMQNGLYLVRISKIVSGKEQIPSKYNEHTILGCEIAARAAYMPGPVVFDITTK